MAFDKANTGLDAALSNAGVGPGSSRAKLAVTAAWAKRRCRVHGSRQRDERSSHHRRLHARTRCALRARPRRERRRSARSNEPRGCQQQRTQAARRTRKASLMNQDASAAAVGDQVAGFGIQQSLKGGFSNPFGPSKVSPNGPGPRRRQLDGGTDVYGRHRSSARSRQLPVRGRELLRSRPWLELDYANNTYSDVTRDQWSNYVNRTSLCRSRIGSAFLMRRTRRSRRRRWRRRAPGINQGFDAQAGSTQRRLQGFGVTLYLTSKRASTKASGLQRLRSRMFNHKTTPLVDLTVQRQQSILGSPAPQGV